MTDNNNRHPLILLFLKMALLAVPFLLLTALYVWKDPFMVLRHNTPQQYDNSPYYQGEGYVGWEKLKQLSRQNHYDAFLLGNSCTKAFACTEWNKYIHARPFRFFSNNENLGDLCLKLRALDSLYRRPVRHLLVITEVSSFRSCVPQEGPMNIMPSDVSGASASKIQLTFFRAYLDTRFLLPYLRYQVLGRYDRGMQNRISSACPTRTLLTNDAVLYQDDAIRAQGKRFWEGRRWTSLDADIAHPVVQPAFIKQPQRACLQTIRNFCVRHHADLKLVIGPNCHGEQLNPRDLKALQDILGKDNVFDYTHSRRFSDYHGLYYDGSHFRRLVGTAILKDIYADGQQAR